VTSTVTSMQDIHDVLPIWPKRRKNRPGIVGTASCMPRIRLMPQ
jgi:hypothetical protein